MIVLGKYIVEPYFTTPADAIVNSLALLIALSALTAGDRSALQGYAWILYYGYAVLGAAVLAISTKDLAWGPLRWTSILAYRLSALFGKSHVMFSVLYLAASWSYLAVA